MSKQGQSRSSRRLERLVNRLGVQRLPFLVSLIGCFVAGFFLPVVPQSADHATHSVGLVHVFLFFAFLPFIVVMVGSGDAWLERRKMGWLERQQMMLIAFVTITPFLFGGYVLGLMCFWGTGS